MPLVIWNLLNYSCSEYSIIWRFKMRLQVAFFLNVQVLNPKKKGKKKKYINSGTVSAPASARNVIILPVLLHYCFKIKVISPFASSFLWLMLSGNLFLLSWSLFCLPSLFITPCVCCYVCVCVCQVTLLSFKVESEYTFVDFIRGGWVE